MEVCTHTVINGVKYQNAVIAGQKAFEALVSSGLITENQHILLKPVYQG